MWKWRINCFVQIRLATAQPATLQLHKEGSVTLGNVSYNLFHNVDRKELECRYACAVGRHVTSVRRVSKIVRQVAATVVESGTRFYPVCKGF